jgi:hypothetical protein
MFEMRLETLVNAIVSTELQGKGRENEGLLFSFDVSLTHYVNDIIGPVGRRKGLHLLYQVNPDYSYINVFSAVTDSPFDSPVNATWKHECTHDSCWRNDVDALSHLYFEMAEEINLQLEDSGHARVAPAAMVQNVFPGGIGRDLYRWVPCAISKDPADKHRYRKILTLTSGKGK